MYSAEYPLGTPQLVPCLPLAALTAAAATAPGCPGAALHLDCRALPYRRTQGVCHQVSQLLQLRRTGVQVSLYQANPVLRRCLHQLQLAHLFTWVA